MPSWDNCGVSWRLIGAWAATLVVTTFLTWQIVSVADSQVRESPAAIATPSITPGDDGATTSSSSSSTSTVPATTPSSTVGSSTGGSSPIATSSPTSSSTTSISTVGWSLRTITTVGGTVVVRYRPDEVELQAATPTPGFAMEIEDDGPSRVRVDFESESAQIRVEARWEGSGLDVKVSGDV